MITRTAALAAMLLGALGTPGVALAGTANVVMKDFDFRPMSITIRVGATVVWKNLDAEPHTIVSTTGLFRSNALDQDDSFSFKFDKPGVYQYVCSIHPKMVAVVTVE
jgi:plastocyanin